MNNFEGVISVSFLVSFWLVSCSRVPSADQKPPKPPVAASISWNPDPQSRNLLATFCCEAPVVEELVRPYIPEAQIWGDGRFLWTERHEDDKREVYISNLSPEDLIELLQEIAASGLFDWDKQFMGEPVVDAASQCLTVTLTDKNKSVCSIHNGAPDAIYTLFSWISQGAGAGGSLYRPKKAYLTGFKLEETGVPLPQPEVTWPETMAHLPISEAVYGLWLDDDETLRLFWEAANRDLYHMPVVEDEGGLYRIILQISGVSWIEP